LKLSLGFSPCPNDTFIFDALVNHKIDTEGLTFDVVLEDVQTLNQWALEAKLAVSKISYGVLPLVMQQYLVLNSGGALGLGVGPLLIAKTKQANWEHTMQQATVAIPGQNTTAYLLFSLAFPNTAKPIFMKFNEIEDAVLEGKVDCGVIIHENRFTYQAKGLQKLIDLGSYWEEKLKIPIPLGGIIVNRNLPIALSKKIDALIKKSVNYAFANYPQLSSYVSDNAQEMSESVMRQHIDLYVNNYSLHLGHAGKAAVLKLLEVYGQLQPTIKPSQAPIFIEE